MENNTVNQQETNTAEGTNSQQQEKLFTQDDVNRIVGERLSRVKNDVSPELQERERKAAQRELQLDARERLIDAGLPKELLGAINCSTKEDMENSIKVIQSLYGNKNAENGTQGKTGTYRVISTSTGSKNNGSGYGNGVNDPAEIRRAMGLKG